MRHPTLIWTLASGLWLLPSARAELSASFKSGESTDTRIDRLPALLVEAGESPTPFLAPGAFEVTWSGKLVIPKRQRLHFAFEGEGDATLTIDGEEAFAEQGSLGAGKSERLRLNPGEHDFTLTYRSNDDGSGRFRLFWEERSFPRQSIPPTAFNTGAKPSPERLGRELFATNHCAKCHLPSTGLGTRPMGEMLEIAPLLADTGGRLNEAWLAEWIASPAAVKPDTRMPALVDASTDEGRQQAADLAAWLVTMKLSEPAAAPDAALAQTGGEHFHRLGCVACHTRPDATDDPKRVPLSRVAQKFQPGALVGFLKKPDQWYPHIGMPDFALSDEEANSIAAWLLHAPRPEREAVAFPPGDASKGAELARQLNCGACHAGLPIDTAGIPMLEAIFDKDWSTEGCLTANKELPRFNLTRDESASLVSFSRTGAGAEPLKRHVPAEYATRKLDSLRCTSCHAIDDQRSLLETTHVETNDLVAHVAGEHEKIDQSRPHLTLVGEMLHSSYIQTMIDGKAEPRPRPWLDMRMPAFHSLAAPLAEGFARLHGIAPGEPSAPQPDAELAAIGKNLVGAEGFGCTTCHAIGDMKPTAAFEVEGINFSLAHSRLRREWFLRWMDNPRSVTPDTKMPVYSENGESQRPDILDGDAAEQFDAIWNYLMSLPQ